MVDKHLTKEELLKQAEKPAAEAMRLHAYYRGKTQIALRSPRALPCDPGRSGARV